MGVSRTWAHTSWASSLHLVYMGDDETHFGAGILHLGHIADDGGILHLGTSVVMETLELVEPHG